MFIKKTVVLSSLDNKSQKAVLNIEKNHGEYNGFLRLYNFQSEPSGILTLGFLIDKKVEKAGLTKKQQGRYEFTLDGKLNLSVFTVALVNISGGDAKPIMLGSFGAKAQNIERINFSSAFSLLEKQNLTIGEAEEVLDEIGVDYDEEEKQEIKEAIDRCVKTEDSRCSTCRYRDAFFAKDKDKEDMAEIKEDVVISSDTKKESFYEEILPQIDTLFEKYEPEPTLSKIIPESKWVKVDYEGDGQFYVVGLIHENKELKYICYGVPGMYSAEPPKQLEGFCKWLPLDVQKPFEFGYWLLYQNAETGENEDVEVV